MAGIQWNVKKVNLSELKKNPKNPRRINEHKGNKLKESLSLYGLCEPLVIQPDGTLIGGHQRYELLLHFGETEALCSVPERELTEEELDRLSIMLNKVHGEFDYDMLANNYAEEILLKSGFLPEELCIHEIEKEKEAPKHFSINIKFESEEDLRMVEKELSPIMQTILTAKMKVKIK